jgi:Pilus formation protein N terminal region
MFKKIVRWVCVLVYVSAFAFPAFADQSIGFRQYFKEGVKAFKKHDDPKALRCFKIAQIFDPNDKNLNKYLKILDRRGVILQLPSSQVSEQMLPKIVSNASVQAPVVVQVPSDIKSKSIVSVTAHDPKQAPSVLSLAQITNSGQVKPTMSIELNSSVIIESKNIKRFLVVDEGFIGVKIIDADRLELDAKRIGSTFLHIWDDTGRHTLYVEVVFPKTVTSSELQAMNEIWHDQPFRVTYSNDWSSYYSGKNIPNLKRQSFNFNQSLAVTGETPYGIFDAYGSYSDFNSVSQLDSYALGLSQIPLEGTSNFNLRAFDALRYLSPLTMPGTRLRGVFADVDLMGDNLGLSVSLGQEQPPLGFFFTGGPQFNHSYIGAMKLTLFPKSDTDQYSFNFATGYGPDRQSDLSNHVYSVQGQHKFNDFLTLNAEEGSDSAHNASLVSLKWEDGAFRSGLHFRDINKNYAAVSTLPANQGEIGAAWTTDADFKNISASSFIEAYRDRIDFNPDNPSTLNYDANGHLRGSITQNLWSDSDLNFMDTSGELSPRRSLGLNQRLSRSFGIWNSMKGTVFGGVGYQNSHSSDSNISNYSREDVIAGIQLPITNQISSFANYEYDWLNQPGSNGNSNPNIINAGVEYQKQFTPKLSFNSQLVFRDELGVKGSNNSFLSGERSVIITSGFAYNPTPDISIFADGDTSKVLSYTGNPSYDDFEFHLGVRITFGGATYWDPLGIVSGVVFKDRNGDGKYVSGDEGIPGVKLKVGDKEVITDKQGRYRVPIRAKGVEVVPVQDTIPGGFIFSTSPTLNVEIIQGRISHADFGLISQTGIYGIVFVDKNGSGVPNSGNQFVSKVKVILDGKIIQKSDLHGAFYFRKVTPGLHTISIDINTIALNMVPLVKLKNKIDVPEGVNYMFNIPIQIKQQDPQQN